MVGLTAKQRRVLAFIQEAYRRTGSEPPYREIADHMEVTVRAAAQHVEALEKKGYLSRKRGILLSDDFRPPRGLPLLGRVAAGRPIMADENIEEYLDPELLFGISPEDRVFALRAPDDSMAGKGILQGDLLLARPLRGASGERGEGARAALNDKIVVAIVGDEAIVKTYHERIVSAGGREQKRILLEPAPAAGSGSAGSDGTRYPTIDVTDNKSFRLAGRVLACHRKL